MHSEFGLSSLVKTISNREIALLYVLCILKRAGVLIYFFRMAYFYSVNSIKQTQDPYEHLAFKCIGCKQHPAFKCIECKHPYEHPTYKCIRCKQYSTHNYILLSNVII